MHQIDLGRIDLNLLVVFEVLHEERHVGRAAKRLHLSQSATSHALGRLRRVFDDPLFLRHPRGIEPTPRAKELASLVSATLADIRRFVAPAPAFTPKALARDFRIATHDYGMTVLLTPLIARLRTEAPNVNLRCPTLPRERILDALDRGEIDLAIGGLADVDAERMKRIVLFEDRFVGIARRRHPALEKKRLSLGTFLSFPHVLVASGGESRGDIDNAFTGRRRVAVTTSSFLAVPGIVANTDLFGILPERLAAQICPPQAFAQFDLPFAMPAMKCSALVPRALASQAEMAWLLESLTQGVSWTQRKPRA